MTVSPTASGLGPDGLAHGIVCDADALRRHSVALLSANTNTNSSTNWASTNWASTNTNSPNSPSSPSSLPSSPRSHSSHTPHRLKRNQPPQTLAHLNDDRPCVPPELKVRLHQLMQDTQAGVLSLSSG